jgi:hypothetical protein
LHQQFVERLNHRKESLYLEWQEAALRANTLAEIEPGSEESFAWSSIAEQLEVKYHDFVAWVEGATS